MTRPSSVGGGVNLFWRGVQKCAILKSVHGRTDATSSKHHNLASRYPLTEEYHVIMPASNLPSNSLLGQQLELLAQTQGITQQTLADALAIHRATISKVFKGQVQKLTHYESIARELGTSLTDIVQELRGEDPLAGVDHVSDDGSPSGKALSRARGKSANVITVAIQKGGSGKTTTVVNLATLWASLGLDVLIIDLDMQGHCALHLGQPSDGHALMDAIRTRQKVEPLKTAWGVDLLAGGSALRALTPHLLSSISPLTELKKLVKLYQDDYDVILIDTAPSLETSTCNAIVAADFLLIPVQTETGALEGLATLYEVYEMLAEDHGPIHILASIPTLHDARTVLHDQMLQTLQQHAHLRPTEAVIKRSVPVAEAFTMREPLMHYAPDSSAAKAFEELSTELVERLVEHGALVRQEVQS